jgi:hypothetical protein
MTSRKPTRHLRIGWIALLAAVVVGYAGPSGHLALAIEDMAACTAGRERLTNDLLAMAAQSARGCRHDSDCKLADVSVSCQALCPVAIVATRAPDMRARADTAGAQACNESLASCGTAGLCPTYNGARCDAGICRPIIPGLRPSKPSRTDPEHDDDHG